MSKLAIFFILASMLIGCSDPRAANNTNLKNALNEYLKIEKLCIKDTNYVMPAQIKLNDKRNQEALDLLAQSGLLTKEITSEIIRNSANSISAMFGEKPKKEQIYKYELTETGKQNYKVEKNFMFSIGSFCYGSAQVDKINSFTEPADFMGKKVVEVSYTYKLFEHSKWIEADIFKSHRTVADNLNSQDKPISKKETLVLTNEGWKHPSLL